MVQNGIDPKKTLGQQRFCYDQISNKLTRTTILIPTGKFFDANKCWSLIPNLPYLPTSSILSSLS